MSKGQQTRFIPGSIPSLLKSSIGLTVISLAGLVSSFIWSNSHASEVFFQVDPRVNLGKLELTPEMIGFPGKPNPDKVVTSFSSEGTRYRVDASAVFSNVRLDDLHRVSTAYRSYGKYGLPHLDEVKWLGIDPVTQEQYVWNRMSYLVVSSAHFLKVGIFPNLVSTHGGRASGTSWRLVSGTDIPSRVPSCKNCEDESAFDDLAGSWYMEELPTGAIYVRYLMEADVDLTLVPDHLVRSIAMNDFPAQAKDVVRIFIKQSR